MESGLIVKSQNGIPSEDQKAQQTCVRVTPHYGKYIKYLFEIFYIKLTLKSVRMKFIFSS